MPPIRKSLTKKRTEQLACNVFDLDKVDPSVREKLKLSDKISRQTVDMRFDRVKESDEAAVVFNCDLLTAALICDILRSHDREMGDSPTRLYLKRKSWSRIPSYVVLTVVVNGHTELNPEVFPTAVPLVDLVPLPPKRIHWSKP